MSDGSAVPDSGPGHHLRLVRTRQPPAASRADRSDRFVAAGFVLAEGLEILDLALEPHLVKVIAEVTLVWVLFADASRVRPSQFRRDLGLYGRLLGVGLPLTVAWEPQPRWWCSTSTCGRLC